LRETEELDWDERRPSLNGLVQRFKTNTYATGYSEDQDSPHEAEYLAVR